MKRALWVPLLLVPLAALGQPKGKKAGVPGGKKISSGDAQTLRAALGEYLGTSDAQKRRKILERVKRYAEYNLSGLEEAFRQGWTYPASRGTLTRDCSYSPAPYKSRYFVHLPPNYDPSRPWPLLFTLWSDGEAYFRQDWARFGPAGGYICVAPSVGKGDIGWANDKDGEKVLFTLIEEMCRDFHVDPNRIYLAGRSAGGYGCWIHGMENPDRFGGIAPFMAAPSDPEPCAESLFNLPVWFGYSDSDERTPPSLPILKQLPDWKYDHVIRNFKGGHLAEIGNAPAEVLQYFDKRPRKVYPKKIVYVPFDTKHRRAYWAEILQGGNYRTTRLEAEIRGKNEIHLRCRGISSVRLYLHDAMVNLDQPVKVLANGNPAFEGKVERSIEFLFRHIDETKDRGRVFSAAIDVPVP